MAHRTKTDTRRKNQSH